MLGCTMVGVELEAKSWRFAEPGVKMASSSLSAVEVFMMEERAVRMEGPVKSRGKGSPALAKALRMAVILTVSAVEREPSLVS